MAGFDLDDIAKHYAKMDDGDIIRIATQEAAGLRPGVIEIIQKEVEKRNLNPDIIKGALAQTKEYTLSELQEYSEKVRSVACPVCNQKTRKLNATMVYKIKSFVFFSSLSQTPVIACPDCLDRKNDNAVTSSLLLGWWGIPWGVLKTPVYIYRNLKAKKQNHLEKPNETLLAFTLSNIGEIETYIDNPDKLKWVIEEKR
jgi:hypothetical protein